MVEPSSSSNIVEAIKKAKAGDYSEIPLKRFSWDENVDKTLEIYYKLTGK